MSRAYLSAAALILGLAAGALYGPTVLANLPGWTSADTQAQILALKPARELVVQKGDAMVHGMARKSALIGADSEVHYLARATLRYSADLRHAVLSFRNDQSGGVVSVRVPSLRVEASVDPRSKQKIASLALLSTEGGTGNDLESLADRDLQAEAEREAKRPESMETARRAALFEIKELYEQPLRAMGNTSRVEVILPGA